jgi:uncharacterized protein (DUF1800 family)
MPANPLRPLARDAFDYWKALHLLQRAGFGGTPDEVRTLANLGLEAAVDSLVDFDRIAAVPTTLTPSANEAERPGADGWDMAIMRPPTSEERAMEAAARRANDEETLARLQRERGERERRDRDQLARMRRWWMHRMLETQRPLEEKLTLFWHGHFATGYRTIENSYHMARQNALFRAYAAGSFQRLVVEIIRDPAMLKYLDNDENRRSRPNENLARELMELFVLGEGNGYTERDIKEGARALTGYSFVDDDFVFDANEHDDAPKNLFGRVGRWNGEDFVRLLFTLKGSSEFLCLKLVRFFVTDAPGPVPEETREVVRALAKELRDADFELRPVLRTLFRSEFFYAPQHVASVIKSPVQLIVQSIRSLRTPIRSIDALVSASALMGQDLFQPPNVKGWDGGRSWINTATLFIRQNFLIYLLTGRRPAQFEWPESRDRSDVTHLLADLRRDLVREGGVGAALEPETLARYLLRFCLAARPHPERVATLAAFLGENESAPENDRLLAALCLITALPEFQLS